MKQKDPILRPKILMIDDDLDLRTILQSWLLPQFEFFGLGDGEDLLETLSAVQPDLIIMDVRLPGDDGFSLCRSIRANSRFRDLPILFLTGCADDADFVKNLDAGGTAYLTKPILRKQLLFKLKELLNECALP